MGLQSTKKRFPLAACFSLEAQLQSYNKRSAMLRVILVLADMSFSCMHTCSCTDGLPIGLLKHASLTQGKSCSCTNGHPIGFMTHPRVTKGPACIREAGEPAAAQGQPHYFNIAPEQYQPINRRLLEKEERGAQRTDSTHVSNFITSEQLPGSDAGALRTRVTLISVMEHNGAERTPAEILSTLAQPGADTIVTSSRGDIAGQATSGSQASKAIDDTRPSRSIIPAYRPWSIISHINGALGCKGSSASLISCVSDVVRRWLPKKSVAPTQGVLTQGVDAALKQYNEEQIFHSLFNDPSVLGTQSWAEASKNTHDDVLRRSHAKDLAMHTVADALGDHANHGSISDAAEQD